MILYGKYFGENGIFRQGNDNCLLAVVPTLSDDRALVNQAREGRMLVLESSPLPNERRQCDKSGSDNSYKLSLFYYRRCTHVLL